MRHRHRTALLPALLVITLLATACGGDDESSDRTWPDARQDRPVPTTSTESTRAAETTTTWASSDRSGRSRLPAEPEGFGEYRDAPYPDVAYEHPGINPPEYADEDRLSTFALDVDTGSYTIARTYVHDGHLPDPDSVRVEEYINFFSQDYPTPRPGEGFTITVDGGPTPFVDRWTRVVRVGLRAEDVEDRPPAVLTFVIDTSGSMRDGGRLEMVKDSLEMLVDQLDRRDVVSIVEFGSEPSLVLGPTFADEKREIMWAIRRLTPGGSTNFEGGLRMGYDVAARMLGESSINRVVVASDGVANVGLTDAPSMIELIERDAERGINLVTVGVGMGNYNDTLLEQLADRGDGFYAYVDTPAEAERLFVWDLTGTLLTVAKDGKVQVDFDPDAVLTWRLVGFENRELADRDFRDDSVDAGELGAGHAVTALYELELTDRALDDRNARLGRVHLRWLDPDTDDPRELSRTFTAADLEDRWERTAPRFRQDVVVAQYAELLRRSPGAGAHSLDELIPHARELRELLPRDRDVAELADLIERAAWLVR